MTSCYCLLNHHKLAIKWCFSVIYASLCEKEKINLSFYGSRKSGKSYKQKYSLLRHSSDIFYNLRSWRENRFANFSDEKYKLSERY